MFWLIGERKQALLKTMVQIVVVRAGSTDFDEQGRIKGTLDLPLSDAGKAQVSRIVADLQATAIETIYVSPCRSAQETAELLAAGRRVKIKTIDELQNLDHGLWHGKLIDEVRVSQPRVFRQLQDHPETVCPPQGEPVSAALERIRSLISRLLRKHRTGTVAVVVPEPVAAFVVAELKHAELGDLWKAECECGGWESIEIRPEQVAVAG
jgi:broad specificity phosphatase PhoE